MAAFAPTKQQQNVTEYFEAAFGPDCSTKHAAIFLNAVAGAGKTSTIMLQVAALAEIEKNRGCAVKACSVSFNTNIRDASQLKLTAMGSSVQAKTTNQLGRSILVDAARNGLCRQPGKLENGKYRAIVEARLEEKMNNKRYFPKFRDYTKAITAVVELVDAVRSTQVEATEENILDIISHYNLQDKIDVTAASWPLVWESVAPVIQQGIKDYNKTGIHDFNDQICLPLSLDVAAPLWDVIFIDEAQDLNRARLEMMVRSIKANGVLFFVGDPQQAIQGFTFADTDSVNTIKRVTNAVEFPLSVCWRCDEDIINLAKVLVPHIEARPNAPKGIINTIDSARLMTALETGYKRGTEEKDADLVLCRVKAPLVQMCLEAIRNGKSAIVRGRDIGKGIISLLDDILPVPFSVLRDALDEYTFKKIDKLFGKKDAETKIAEIEDRSDTLKALLDGYLDTLKSPENSDIDDFKAFINSKFADDETAEQAAMDRVKPIVFSTIHKAKGLEYDRVFILEPGKLPHPAAKSGWQMEQEYNILYVAVTRAKHELYFVGGVPAILANEFTSIVHPEELDAAEMIETAELIVNGHTEEPDAYVCIVCDRTFKASEIDNDDNENGPCGHSKDGMFDLVIPGQKPRPLFIFEEEPEAPTSPSEPNLTPETVETDNQPSTTGKRPYGGRKALPDEDKRVFFQQTWDPSIRNAFREYTQAYNAENKSNLSEAEMLEELLLSHEGFSSFFYKSQHSDAYADRQYRAEQARQDYKNRKRAKK